MSAALLLGPGVVLPIAHVVVDDDGIKNLRNALGLTPQLPDPNAGETAGDYAARTGTTLSAELPADHRYDPWAVAPDGSPGWWIGPSDPFNLPPGAGNDGLSPIVIGLALESTGYGDNIDNLIAFVDGVCANAAARGAGILGYIRTGSMDAPPSLDFVREVCDAAWVSYCGGGDSDVPRMTEEQVADFYARLIEVIGGQRAQVTDALPPEAGEPVEG